MSFVTVGPETILAKATDLAGVASAIKVANANAAAQTTDLPAAAADQVSAAIATLYGSHAQDYQALGAQMTTLHDQLVQNLSAAGNAYASAEASNVQQSLLAAVNAPIQALLGHSPVSTGATAGP